MLKLYLKLSCLLKVLGSNMTDTVVTSRLDKKPEEQFLPFKISCYTYTLHLLYIPFSFHL